MIVLSRVRKSTTAEGGGYERATKGKEPAGRAVKYQNRFSGQFHLLKILQTPGPGLLYCVSDKLTDAADAAL
ncbi:hypothetical protein U1Q18_051263 [Sarracenia purpurea var. burkii]